MPLRSNHNPFHTTRESAQSRTLRVDYSGDRLFKAGVQKVELWKPDFSAYDNVIRPYPTPDPDGGFLSCFNSQGDPNGWYFDLPVLSSMGRGWLTIIIDDNSRATDELRTQSPVYLLYNAISKASAMIKRGDRTPDSWRGWPLLLERVNGQGGGQSIMLPDLVGFFQGSVFRGGKGPYVKDENPAPGAPKGHAMEVNDGNGDPPRGGCPDDPAVFIMLPPSARKSFVRELFAGDGGVEVTNIAPSGGKFIHVFNQDNDPREVLAPQSQAPAQRAGFGGPRHGVVRPQVSQSSGFGKGYDVYFSDYLDHFHQDDCRADCLVGHEEMIRNQWRDPAEVIWFPSDEEIANLIARMCGPADEDYKGRVRPIPIEALDYAWGDFPTWIPEDVRRVATHRKVVNVPNDVPETPTSTSSGIPGHPGGQAVAHPTRQSPFRQDKPTHPAHSHSGSTAATTAAAECASDKNSSHTGPVIDPLTKEANQVFGNVTTEPVPPIQADTVSTAPNVAGAIPMAPMGKTAEEMKEDLRRRVAASEARMRLEQEAKNSVKE